MKLTALFHPCYAAKVDQWEAIEDVCQGGRRIKERGTIYLPKLNGETDDEYRNRKFRAVFFNATNRTREALVGMLMRKPPKITVPAEIEGYTADIDMAGATIKNWVRTVASQVVSTGRAVTIADWNEEEQRPYLSYYPAVNVINWSTSRIGGRTKLSLLIVKECTEEATADSGVLILERYRQFTIEADGTVWVKVWVPGKRGAALEQADSFKQLTRKGIALTDIPAVCHNASHLGWEVGNSPLLDVADLNLAHYNGSADLENGRHICGIPTPYATGIGQSDDALKLGSTKAWTSEQPEAKFGFIEFTGAGLSELVTGQEEKERQMAILGARLLFDNKKDAESYETVRLRSVSETATLSNMSGYLSATMTQAIRWLIWWTTVLDSPAALPAEIGVIVNDDFIDTPMSEAWLTALVAALQSNSISADTFFFQCEKGELYPPDWDLQKEAAAIAQRPPSMVPPAPPAPKPDPNNPEPEPKPKPEPAAA